MKPINPKDLKIRASQISKVVTFDRSAQLTEKQSYTLEKLLTSIKLTDAQAMERDRLIAKRDAPDTLSAGGKTYVRELFYEHVSGTRRIFSSKFTDKGNFVEKKEISEVCKFLGLPIVVKNLKQFENDWSKGSPDTLFKPLNFQMDVKAAYFPHNLDFFDPKLDTIYEWQQRDYNWLTETEHSLVCKVLLNPPVHILEREVFALAKEAGIHFSEITEDFREEVRDYFDYESRMPLHDRINVYNITTDKSHVDTMKKGVELAREYYGELIESWNSKNKEEIKFIKTLLKK